MRAYVLIQTETGTPPIAKTLQAIPGVVSASDLMGPYDAIAVARFASTHLSSDSIVAKVLDLPGVTRALPVQVVSPASPARRDEAA
jgi:hypothetical protein